MTAVDHYRQIIVACDVTDATVDTQQLLPLLDQVRANTGRQPAEVSADSGYWSEENVTGVAARGSEPYIPPPRPARRAGQAAPPTVHANPCKAQMAAKLATPAAAKRYQLRMETAEPVYGQMKEGRGLRRFCSRGLAKVRGEWALWCLTHNLLKLTSVFRAKRVAQTAHTPYLVALGRLRPRITTIYSVSSPFAPITGTTACGSAVGRPVRTIVLRSTTNARSSAAFTYPTLVSQTGS